MANGEGTTVDFGFGKVVTDANGKTTVTLPDIVDVGAGDGGGTTVNLGEGVNISTPPAADEGQRRTPAARGNNRVNFGNSFQDIALNFPGGSFNLDSLGMRTDYPSGTVTVGSDGNFSGPVKTNVNGLDVNALVNQFNQVFG